MAVSTLHNNIIFHISRTGVYTSFLLTYLLIQVKIVEAVVTVTAAEPDPIKLAANPSCFADTSPETNNNTTPAIATRLICSIIICYLVLLYKRQNKLALLLFIIFVPRFAGKDGIGKSNR